MGKIDISNPVFFPALNQATKWASRSDNLIGAELGHHTADNRLAQSPLWILRSTVKLATMESATRPGGSISILHFFKRPNGQTPIQYQYT